MPEACGGFCSGLRRDLGSGLIGFRFRIFGSYCWLARREVHNEAFTPTPEPALNSEQKHAFAVGWQ